MIFRITPAHAGTSPAGEAADPVRSDHPRTRGDKKVDIRPQQIERGSPPHTRGQVLFFVAYMIRGRITPAHAGTRALAAGNTYTK